MINPIIFYLNIIKIKNDEKKSIVLEIKEIDFFLKLG